MASFGDAATGDNQGNRHGDNQRKVPYAGNGGTGVLNALEVNGNIIYDNEVRPCEEKCVKRVHQDEAAPY